MNNGIQNINIKKILDYFIKFNELRLGKEIKLIMDNKY